MSDLVQSIRDRYLRTLDRIAVAARSVNRDPDDVKLVVVTKTQPLEVVQAAVEAGVRILGENYPEEGVMKIQSMTGQIGVEWHMIGHVQSRKANLVAEYFNMVHSLDSLKLAARLDRFAGEFGRALPALLEFNVGGEQSKSGWNVMDDVMLDALMPEMETLLAFSHLQVRGLMTMPPLGEDPESARVYFRKLVRFRDTLAKHFPQADWSALSMGTSTDYEVAVQEGATMVRIGTAIIGARHYKTEVQ
jgi:pyridoxal phosphate enzyme (YggS family)